MPFTKHTKHTHTEQELNLFNIENAHSPIEKGFDHHKIMQDKESMSNS